jgi:hypothetical protein
MKTSDILHTINVLLDATSMARAEAELIERNAVQVYGKVLAIETRLQLLFDEVLSGETDTSDST